MLNNLLLVKIKNKKNAAYEEELIARVTSVLDRCQKHNLILSLKKLEFGESVTFAGFKISKDGVEPDPTMTLAIKDFPVPMDVTGTRSFLGLAQQLAWFIPDLAHITNPLRKLLCKGVAFQWLEDHQAAFEKAKEVLTSKLLVKHFDPDLKTDLVTDHRPLEGVFKKGLEDITNARLRGFREKLAPYSLQSYVGPWQVTSYRRCTV
jgi:hypothetical protein